MLGSIDDVLERRRRRPRACAAGRCGCAAAAFTCRGDRRPWSWRPSCAPATPPIPEYVAVQIVPAARLGVEKPPPRASPEARAAGPGAGAAAARSRLRPRRHRRSCRNPRPPQRRRSRADAGPTSRRPRRRRRPRPRPQHRDVAGLGAGQPPGRVARRRRRRARQSRLHLRLLRRPDAGADPAQLGAAAGRLAASRRPCTSGSRATAGSATCASSLFRDQLLRPRRRCAPCRPPPRCRRCPALSRRARSAST